MIALTVTFHVWFLEFIFTRIVGLFGHRKDDARIASTRASLTMVVFTVLAIVAHAIESAIWAAAYVLLGALPDARSAMLYSVNAMTTFGHTDIDLTDQWKMMGPLEALNGILLFGLTTAFLFSLIQHFSLASSKRRHE